MDIIEAIYSDRIFKPLFDNLESWRSWETFLKTLFGLPIEDRSERRLFRQCTGLRTPPNQQAREAYCICGRRAGKSWISSVAACWLSCFKNWRPYLGPGEKAWVFVISVDRAQAQVAKNYTSAILSSSPVFRRMVERELKDEIHLKNDVNIAVKTCDFRSVRGFTIGVAILEELSFWRDSEISANPSEEILRAVRPALATVPGSLLLAISTPYSKAGTLWNQYHSHYGKNSGPFIWKAPTELMNPTLDRKIIKDAIRDDPCGGKSEWLAEFREDTAAFLQPELVDDCIIQGRSEVPVLQDVSYIGFTDPSAGRRDSFALAIAHHDRDTGKVILDVCLESRPPFRPEATAKEFSGILKKYGVYQI